LVVLQMRETQQMEIVEVQREYDHAHPVVHRLQPSREQRSMRKLMAGVKEQQKDQYVEPVLAAQGRGYRSRDDEDQPETRGLDDGHGASKIAQGSDVANRRGDANEKIAAYRYGRWPSATRLDPREPLAPRTAARYQVREVRPSPPRIPDQ